MWRRPITYAGCTRERVSKHTGTLSASIRQKWWSRLDYWLEKLAVEADSESGKVGMVVTIRPYTEFRQFHRLRLEHHPQRWHINRSRDGLLNQRPLNPPFLEWRLRRYKRFAFWFEDFPESPVVVQATKGPSYKNCLSPYSTFISVSQIYVFTQCMRFCIYVSCGVTAGWLAWRGNPSCPTRNEFSPGFLYQIPEATICCQSGCWFRPIATAWETKEPPDNKVISQLTLCGRGAQTQAHAWAWHSITGSLLYPI